MRPNYLKLLRNSILLGIVALNIIACNHAWRFTHFSESTDGRTKPEELSLTQKLSVAFLGVPNPRPTNPTYPDTSYETIQLHSHETLEGWLIDFPESKGVVALFHGYTGCKGKMLNYAKVFQELGYTTFLLDFMGSGGSDGNQTTIGYKEARDVRVAYEYLRQRFPQRRLILMGESMGAAALMRAMATEDITPDQIILHCPFTTMRSATQRRFGAMGLPSFVLADLLMVYGGILNGFNPYLHQPLAYAKRIDLPTLLVWGAKDARVPRSETDDIFTVLGDPKSLVILPNSGHENYLIKDRESWEQAVGEFLP